MKRLRIAIQKSGRLTEASKELLKECGINIQNGKRQLLAPSTNFPLDIYYLRNGDIPQYIEDGVADIGILGENVFVEKQADIKIIKRLGFAKCRLSIAVPKSTKFSNLEQLNGQKIATTYSTLLQQFLDKNKIEAELHNISGSVEIAPNIGLADAICDIVSSGSTLFSNGLKEVATVMQSEAVLVANKKLEPWKQGLINKLLFRIDAVRNAQSNKYILLNVPNEAIEEISAILPGIKSPTILPLAKEGWSSLHSVVVEEQFWEIIDQLRDKGAEGILVIPIEKMIA
ncbi:MAG: ATP phosphoribosyltransferase [Aureispira sp.]|nr:ATP phosphoribosyltransferase [Aureispira sp.]